jgi:hypothetical protein
VGGTGRENGGTGRENGGTGRENGASTAFFFEEFKQELHIRTLYSTPIQNRQQQGCTITYTISLQ